MFSNVANGRVPKLVWPVFAGLGIAQPAGCAGESAWPASQTGQVGSAVGGAGGPSWMGPKPARSVRQLGVPVKGNRPARLGRPARPAPPFLLFAPQTPM